VRVVKSFEIKQVQQLESRPAGIASHSILPP
jgi:hypothetical protein